MDLPEREILDLTFVQVLRTYCSNVKTFINSPVIVSNLFGIIVTATLQGLNVYAVKELDTLLDKFKFSKKRQSIEGDQMTLLAQIKLVSTPLNISLSNDELILSVCLKKNSFLFVEFYDIRSFVNKSSNISFFQEIKLTNVHEDKLFDFLWNPGADCTAMFAVCITQGVNIYELKDNSVHICANIKNNSIETGAKCLSWSPKGKQLVIGKNDGTLVQFTPTGIQKKEIPVSPDVKILSGINNISVLNIVWESTSAFFVVYVIEDSQSSFQPHLVYIRIQKDGSFVYNLHEDICYGTLSDIPFKYQLHLITEWNILIASSVTSSEISLLGRRLDNPESWERYNLDGEGRPEVPSNSDYSSNYPIGFAICLNSKYSLEKDQKIFGPAPLLLVMSTSGELVVFYVNNSSQSRPSILKDYGELDFKEARKVLSLSTNQDSSSTSQLKTSSGFYTTANNTLSFTNSADGRSSKNLELPSKNSTGALDSSYIPKVSEKIDNNSSAQVIPTGKQITKNLDQNKVKKNDQKLSEEFVEKNENIRDPFLDHIKEEVLQFAKELKNLRLAVGSLNFNIGVQKDKELVNKNIYEISKFYDQSCHSVLKIKDSLIDLKTECQENFSTLFDCKNLLEKYRDREHHQLMLRQPLDEMRRQKIDILRDLLFRAKNEVKLIDQRLDHLWKENNAGLRNRPLKVPIIHEVYDALRCNSRTLYQMEEDLSSISAQLCRMGILTTSMLNSNKPYTQAANNTELLVGELSRMQVTKQWKIPNEKLKQLKEYYLNRKSVPIVTATKTGYTDRSDKNFALRLQKIKKNLQLDEKKLIHNANNESKYQIETNNLYSDQNLKITATVSNNFTINSKSNIIASENKPFILPSVDNNFGGKVIKEDSILSFSGSKNSSLKSDSNGFRKGYIDASHSSQQDGSSIVNKVEDNVLDKRVMADNNRNRINKLSPNLLLKTTSDARRNIFGQANVQNDNQELSESRVITKPATSSTTKYVSRAVDAFSFSGISHNNATPIVERVKDKSELATASSTSKDDELNDNLPSDSKNRTANTNLLSNTINQLEGFNFAAQAKTIGQSTTTKKKKVPTATLR